MLTAFGIYVRKLRIDNGMLLKNMAETLNVTSSFLSAVETGKRNIPADWGQKIARIFCLNEAMQADLEQAIKESQAEIQIELRSLSKQQRDLAFVFARKLDTLDDAEIKDFFKVFIKNESEDTQ